MARPLRIQYPGAVYHVTCRGNEQKAIYKDDADRRRFLEYLPQSLDTYSVKLYSYILMTNHLHLLVQTPLGNLGGKGVRSLILIFLLSYDIVPLWLVHCA